MPSLPGRKALSAKHAIALDSHLPGRASRLNTVEGFWPIFFLLVVLKIPVFASLWLVWWASKTPEEDGAIEDSGNGFRRPRPLPIRPRGPRRGSGGGVARPLPTCPPGGRTHVVRPAALPASARGGSRADRDGNRPRSCDA